MNFLFFITNNETAYKNIPFHAQSEKKERKQPIYHNNSLVFKYVNKALKKR